MSRSGDLAREITYAPTELQEDVFLNIVGRFCIEYRTSVPTEPKEAVFRRLTNKYRAMARRVNRMVGCKLMDDHPDVIIFEMSERLPEIFEDYATYVLRSG